MKKVLLTFLSLFFVWQFAEAQSLEDYDEATPIMGKYFSVKNGEKHAVTDASGKIISEWVDAVIPIDSHYTQLVKVNGRNKACAIMSESGKMLTGFDFAWVYTMDAEGLVPVRLNQDWRDIKLKLIGDKLYIVGDKSEGMYAIKDQKTKKNGHHV